jgi:arabinofuranosyltransferase
MRSQRVWQEWGARAGDGVALFAILWFVFVVVRSAWQCDDAYITFRTVENFWHGLGLVWNPGERVQSYSSPLWMFVAAILRGISGEVYFSVSVASILFAAATAGLIAFRIRRDPLLAALVLAALSTSAAVVDYATSGLENPLLHLLLIRVLIEARRPDSARHVFRISLLTALTALTRLDAILFALPALCWAAWRHRPRSASAAQLLLGLSPLIAWELFSLVYYGSFVPNTAHAKLNLDISPLALALQALRYFADSARFDPITLLLVFAGAGASFWKGRTGERLVAAGVLLYLLYLVRIGGDFMSGRFFAAPAVAAGGLLVSLGWPSALAEGSERRRIGCAVAAVALCLYGMLWPYSRWFSGSEYGLEQSGEPVVRASGIADERAYYYASTGLLRVLRYWDEIEGKDLPVPPYRGAFLGREFSQSPRRVRIMNEVGFFGYFAGPEKTVIDYWALSDPLLARLPFRPEKDWRIGHYPRRIPKGYRETVASGKDRFADRRIADYYRGIASVTQGPLFTVERWREIWRLHTGHYDAIRDRPDYR